MLQWLSLRLYMRLIVVIGRMMASFRGGWSKALVLQLMIMQNNHYSTNYYIIIDKGMEKNHSKTLGLTIHQEKLRERIDISCIRYEPSLTTTCTPSSPMNLTKENISPVKDTSQRSRINWIKYNILVSIYQNWLRLEPFIRYWLEKTYQESQEQPHVLWQYLRKWKDDGAPQQNRKKQSGLDILCQMKIRRQELLKGFDPSQIDIEHLSHARQLAKQLLSSLPLDNNKWTKIRIQKQNRLLDQMINNFNEDEFKMNSQVIIHSIKQRIYFIDQMQKKFIDVSKEQQNMLEEKLQLLKQPFKKVFSKANKLKIQPEALFENLWHQIEDQRNKLLTKKPQLRRTHKKFKNKQRYAILQKSQSVGLVVKYHLKHGDYFNDSYARSRYQKNRTKKMKSRSKNEEISVDQSLQASKLAQMTKDSVDELKGHTLSNISSSVALQQNQQEINSQFVEDFMRRQKLKQTYRQQNNNFFKKTPTKFESGYGHYRPSISYIDGRSNKDTDMSAIKSGLSISRERTSVFARRESRHRPSGEQITQKQDHLSRFRSHKKLITLKNIGGANRHTKLNKQQGKKDSQLDSLTRISAKLSKLQKKEFRREQVDYRKGVLHKKGTQRKDITMDQQINIVPDNLTALNRQQFLNYFNKILGAGHLDQQRFQTLKQQVKSLVKKNEPPAMQQTHLYVQKLVQKSSEEQFRCLLGEGRQQLLVELFDVISKDERIRARIRDQMKIFFNQSIEECCSEDSICNEQLLYNTTELRKVNQELRRIVCFKAEGQRIDFANRFVKDCSTLAQRSI